MRHHVATTEAGDCRRKGERTAPKIMLRFIVLLRQDVPIPPRTRCSSASERHQLANLSLGIKQDREIDVAGLIAGERRLVSSACGRSVLSKFVLSKGCLQRRPRTRETAVDRLATSLGGVAQGNGLVLLAAAFAPQDIHLQHQLELFGPVTHLDDGSADGDIRNPVSAGKRLSTLGLLNSCIELSQLRIATEDTSLQLSQGRH